MCTLIFIIFITTVDKDQEEMQFLGLFGIYKESFKLIFKLRKIFSQITLTLILPICFIFLAQEEVSDILNEKIWRNKFYLYETKPGTPNHHKLAGLISLESAAYVLLKIFYFAFVLAFSLLSTSAVVYTIACEYTSRDITFKKIMSVVPRVWRRLIVTFLCAFFAFVAYNFVFGLVLYLWRRSDRDYSLLDSNLGVVIFVVVLVLYALGFVYMTIVWQLASVVSVMEDLRGFRAVRKGMRLMRGKMFVAVVIFVKLNVVFVVVYCVFRVFVMSYDEEESSSVLKCVGIGALCLLVLMKVVLFGLVVQTVIYLVCKSLHRENIDKSMLSEHLDVIYLGEYVPLKATAKDVQMVEHRL